jgi:polysaccharide pyruvyl transferase CsaB
MNLLLCGYYGYRNWGDEAALVVLVERLRQMQGAHLVALSGDPPFTQRLTGIEAVPRTDWRRVRRAVQQSDALILGGGSLLQDATSLRSLLYYLLLIHWGLRAHGRVWLVGQGMGPFRRRMSRLLVRQVLRRVPFISVRDEGSATLLKHIGVCAPVRIDADLTWALQARPAHFEVPSHRPCVGVAPRPWRHLPVQAMFVALCCRQLEADWLPLLIPMQESQDRPLCEAIAQAVQERQGVLPPVAPPPEHPAQLLGLMGQLQAMVSMRLHGAIFAAAQGVPLLCLPYDPKVHALAQQVGAALLPLDAQATAMLDQPWQKLHAPLSPPASEQIEQLRQRAHALLDAVRQQANDLFTPTSEGVRK